MNQKHKPIRGRLLLAVLGGSIGAGTIALSPAPAMAIGETVAINESKVPQTVLTTARANFLDARDVNYRVQEGGKKLYQVNYTIPGNLRLQMVLAEDGSVVEQPHPAPNQPENAPKNREREQALAAWTAKVQDAARQRELANRPAVAPEPGNRPLGVPPVAPPAPAAPDATAEIPASQLPAAVADMFQRSAQNARDVRYYRLGTGEQAVYQMLYTSNNGERRELTLDDRGRNIADPRVARQPQVQEGGAEVRWEEVPAAVQKTLLPIAGRDREAKYYRQVQKEGISYGAIYRDNGREMWVRVGENGGIIVNPVLASTGKPVDDRAQPANARLSPDLLRDRVNFADLPKPVQNRVLEATDGAKDVVNMTHRDGNRTVHHTVWTNSRGERQELWLDARGEKVAPPSQK